MYIYSNVCIIFIHILLHNKTSQQHEDCADYLITQGATLHRICPRLGTVLGLACRHGTLSIINLLINADENVVDFCDPESGVTPLMIAAQYGKL